MLCEGTHDTLWFVPMCLSVIDRSLANGKDSIEERIALTKWFNPSRHTNCTFLALDLGGTNLYVVSSPPSPHPRTRSSPRSHTTQSPHQITHSIFFLPTFYSKFYSPPLAPPYSSRVCEVVLDGAKEFTLRQQKYKVSEALKTGEASKLFGMS